MSYASEMMEIWEMVKEQLKLKFGSTAVDLWFGELKMESFRDNALTFSTKSEFKYKIIKDKYIKPIEDEFENLMGFKIKIEVTLESAEIPAEIAKPKVRLDTAIEESP